MVLAICFAFPILKSFFFLSLFFSSSGLKEVGTEVIKDRKKKNRKAGAGVLQGQFH